MYGCLEKGRNRIKDTVYYSNSAKCEWGSKEKMNGRQWWIQSASWIGKNAEVLR